MDFKETLLLPKTNFPMRGNLPTNEPKRYKKWFDENVYNQMKKNRVGCETFTLHDGPPYANGDIHIGHALNKILKDIILKYNYFQGKSVRMTAGWDCHGLPIEQKVEEKIGKSKKDAMPVSQFRELCRQHAKKYVEIQKNSFKSMGITADWDNPYVTMDFKFEANIYRTLCEVAKRGLLVERHKPIHWSWAAQTALAEAEVEYADKEDYSIYVNFELTDEAKKSLNIEGLAGIVIWTTTPWTLPANTGISLNPDEIYLLSSDGYIVAQSRYEDLVKEGVVHADFIKEINATDLENLKAINPLNSRDSHIILGEHVMLDGGSGAVHTAPGHGEDDYKIGLKYNLEIIMPVDERGCYDQSVKGLKLLPDEFVGMHIFKANEPILELLGKNLIKSSKFVHSYPHCWRTKKPLIYRATNQWFIAVDELGNGTSTLRDDALEAIKNVTFYPATSKNRLKPMIETRPDWCISRQRSWGVPIAFFRVKSTKEVIFDEKVLNFVAMIFEQFGADAWYDMSIEQLLYAGSGYKPEELEKVNDILDVWFDSGSTWNCVLKSRNYDAGEYSADVYIEGSDQHRGWFQSSLLLSSAIHAKAPYKNLITHGFTVDEQGKKMSKSVGNVVAPDKVMKEYGSEILRLWVAVSDYQSDLKISNNILKQIAEQYRKIRNTFKFLLSNVDDLEVLVDESEYGDLDRWILSKAGEVFASIDKSFAEYDFLRGFATLKHFVTNELSAIYLDITKDRLYCDDKNAPSRRSTQSAMALITEAMMGLVAPVLTYTVDEIFDFAPKIIKQNRKWVFDMVYKPLPKIESMIDFTTLIEAKESLNEANDRLKKAKLIKSTLELEISGDIDIFGLKDKKDLEDWFCVSGISHESKGEILDSFSFQGENFNIHKASHAKCPRCWKFQSSSEELPCPRCSEVLDV
ncbi:MAG: isoleucyl-tRNA synthase [Sulfurovum sp. AS07-7]|nr:MAG: isoleucyl-tRNA synthase [Sulfurovum sp. AS07-7]